MHIRVEPSRATITALSLALFISLPIIAAADLASVDVSGSQRVAPPTMGALEVASATDAAPDPGASATIAVPAGLVLTLTRSGG